MKKFICAAAAALAIVPVTLCACAQEINLADFISERRAQVYLYADDDIEVKVHISSRETPYLSDGYCGEMSDVCEIFIKFSQSPESVDAHIDGRGGEMSYMSVTDNFYLSFAGTDTGDSVVVDLVCDGEERSVTAPSVLYDGVISPEAALESAKSYDADCFDALTDGKNFEGEIYVRLLADEGRCYYYVGLTDREGNTHAYLVDGENGSVIAERTA